MIELNDKSAPSNLAKSAVLRMLEEEENEKMHPVNNERKSRSRQRAIIDRDTVLKINRYNSSRLRRRDISWPPVQYLDDSKARSSSEEIHSHKNIPHHKEILHLKKTLNTRTIIENDDNDDESNKTNNNKENMLDTHSMKATITKSLSSIKSNNMKIYSNMKRWRSYENSLDSKNILFNNNNKKISTKTNRKGTNLLPRSNSFNELPPLKPRQKYNKNFHSKTKEKLNLNNSNGKYHENHEMMILNQNENSHTNRNMKNENFLLTLKLNENLKIEPKFHNNKNHNDDIRKFQVNKRTNINSFNTPDSRHNSKLRSFKNRMSLQENNHINNSICNTSAIHNVVTTNNQCVDIENNKNDLILLKKHENRILKTTIIDKNIIRSNNKTNITRTNEINNNNNNNNINENFIGKSENINNHINCPIISNLIKNVTNICYNNNRLENDLMRTNNNIQLNNNEIENNNRTNFLINENIILKNMKNENSFNNSDSYDIDDTNEIIWNQQNGLNNIKIYDEIKKNFENFKITPQIMLMTPQITEQMNTITNKDNNTIEIENNIRSTLNIIVKNIERDENLQEIFPVEKSTCNRKNQNNNTNMKIQQENQKSEQFSYIENKTKVNKNLKKREPNKSYGISSTNKGTSTLNNDMKNCQQETSEDILGQDFSSLFYIFGKTMNIHEEENEDYMKMIENSKKHPIENDAERKFLEISIPENLDAHHPYLLNTSIHTRFSPEQYLNETYALKTSIENVMKFLQNRSSPIIRSLNSIKSFPFIITNIEYIPVVEKALLELSDLSKILHKIDNNQEFLVFETITTSGTIPTTTYITTTKTTLTNITTPKITPIIIENDLQIDELDDNSRDDINSTTISLNTISETESNTSQCSTVVTFDKIYQSKNILSGYLITKQNQENLLKNLHLEQYPEQKHHYHYHKDDDKNVNHHEDDHHHNDQKQESQSSNNSLVIVDLVNGKSLQRTFENDPMNIDKHDSIIHNDDKEESMLKNSLKQNNNIKTHQISSITKFYPKLNLYQNNNDIKSTKNDELILNIEQDNENNIGNINFENSNQIKHEKHKHENDNNNNNNNNDDDHKIIVTNKYDINTDAGDILEERLNFNKSNTNNNPLPVIYLGQQKSVQEHQRHHRQQQQHNNIFRQEHNERQEESSSSSSLQSSSNEQQKCDDNVETTNYMYNISSINKIGGSDKIIYDNHMKKMSNENQAIEIVENLNLQTTSKILHLSRCDRIPPIKSYKIRSISQPPSIKSYTISKNYYDKFKKDQHYIPRQYLFDSCDQNRYYSSPSLYMSGHFERTEGYKRVAWPPADSVTPVKGSTPQPQQQQQQQYQNQYQQPQANQTYQPPSGQQQSYQQQPQYQPQQQQQQQYQRGPTPQQQQQNQQLSSQANQPQYSSNRGQSPGIITLRKEAPITQAPAPVFTSQPAARNFKGGSKMRGDLKWPPPDCRALMAAEEEHRRMIEMGPAYRPTKVHKDYSGFFAQHALNSTYPGYKIPPGTQHMYVEY